MELENNTSGRHFAGIAKELNVVLPITNNKGRKISEMDRTSEGILVEEVGFEACQT